jgi:hypothetical protein
MEMRTHFDAPLGRSVWIVTVLTFLVGLTALGFAGSNLGDWPSETAWTATWVWIAVLLLLPVTALFAVRGYDVVPDAVLIRRPGWTSRIPLTGLVGVEVDPQAFCGVVFRAGNGGVLGFIGWFWSRRLGWFRAWVTDPARSVRLRFRDRCVVLSPDDPEAFLRALQLREGWKQ